MNRSLCLLIAGCLAASPLFATRTSKKIAAIDENCLAIQKEFREAAPVIFSGPDPWTQLDEVSVDPTGFALAYVYREGPHVRWLFLRLHGSRKNTWLEDINYYFRDDGTIAKRERVLESHSANLILEEITYYEAGRVLKDKTHHHALGPGRENISEFSDHPPPDYITTDDLPFPLQDIIPGGIAGLVWGEGPLPRGRGSVTIKMIPHGPAIIKQPQANQSPWRV